MARTLLPAPTLEIPDAPPTYLPYTESPTAAADPESLLTPIINILAIGKPDKPAKVQSYSSPAASYDYAQQFVMPDFSYGRPQTGGMSNGTKIAIAGFAALALLLIATRD